MRSFSLTFLSLLASCGCLLAQQTQTNTNQGKTNNIYKIKEEYLKNVLHNPAEEEEGQDDNDLARFNRWFNMVKVRTYPSGNMPSPDVLMRASEEVKQASKSGRKTTTIPRTWSPLGPTVVPTNFNGIGRINCIVIDPVDTNSLYIGSRVVQF